MALSKQVHQLLPDVPIFASGDLDEYEIERLQQAGACIEGYGLGTRLVTGSPVNGVYKLVDIDGIPVMKESASKVTYPGRKQIFRHYDGERRVKDTLGLADESPPESTHPLLNLVMQQGKLVTSPESLEAIAQRTANSVASLPKTVRAIVDPAATAIHPSPALLDLTEATRQTPVPAV